MIDAQIGVLIALVVIVIPLVALARTVDVAYPIVLVIGGLILGFVPGLPNVQLDPDLVLLIFLPPLLYWESITAPTDTMRENAGQIAVLAFGLVIVTTLAVATLAHLMIPGLPWGAAFVLGAIVSPTDELAAVPVLEHFRLPRHVIAIAEGESLLNDATALVLYAAAIVATSSGAFSAGHAVLQFAITVAGSLAVGAIAGRLGAVFWQRVKESQLQGAVSLVLPFLAYFPAQALGLSGVLAVVTAGVYVNWIAPRVITPAARTQIIGFWNTVVFVLNAVLFLMVGLQLHSVAEAVFRHESWQAVIVYAIALNAVIIVVRLGLVVAAEYAPTAAPADHAAPDWKAALVVAWSGLRGAVSLAAALAIPLVLTNGQRFPHRDLLIFLTFTVILMTLVGGGLTLPAVVQRLHLQGGGEERREYRQASIRGADAALARIGELERDGAIDADHALKLREKYEHLRALQGAEDDGAIAHVARHIAAEREINEAQRRALIAMREGGEIDNVVFRRLQAVLDARSTRAVADPNDG